MSEKEKKPIVVDGANVAYVETSDDDEPKVSNIIAVKKSLEAKGYDPIIIIDASLRHEIDDPQQLEALIDDKTIRQAPAGTDADYFILEVAEDDGANVVSNDDFSEFKDDYPWIKERRVPLMIIKGEVELYRLDPESE